MKVNKLSLIFFPIAATVMLSTPAVTQAETVQLASVKQQIPKQPIGSKDLLSALNSITGQSNKLQALENPPTDSVRLVNVPEILEQKDAKAFEEALQRNSEEILRLQDIISKNELLKEVLNKNNVTLKDVVAVNLISARELIVFHF